MNNALVQLTVVDGRPTTTSLDVARHFGKRHDHILRDIQNLRTELPADYLPNFGEVTIEYQNGKGGTQEAPAYRLTRDGFTLLAMGFTGKKALQFKLAYIAEFNRMEAALSSGAALAEATGNAAQLARVAAEQLALMQRLTGLVETQNEVLQGLTQALGAMQVTLATTVRTHSRQIAKAFRLAEQRAPRLAAAAPLDPDRPLSKAEREKALHMWRSGVSGPGISKRLNRTHEVVSRWAATEPEVVRSFMGQGLF
ncbi:Rha family transcriptional regulator [Ottowia sp.]|uniref:Rha family transcriptional regulator n=1 Tax=Ottowia sp. TaxID=1898956 RepID=UPI0025D615A3|nr:Rha family transcriptional regulator [Ottowia sp.]